MTPTAALCISAHAAATLPAYPHPRPCVSIHHSPNAPAASFAIAATRATAARKALRIRSRGRLRSGLQLGYGLVIDAKGAAQDRKWGAQQVGHDRLRAGVTIVENAEVARRCALQVLVEMHQALQQAGGALR